MTLNFPNKLLVACKCTEVKGKAKNNLLFIFIYLDPVTLTLLMNPHLYILVVYIQAVAIIA